MSANQQKAVQGGAAAVILLAAVGVFFFWGRRPEMPQTYKVVGACLACKNPGVEAVLRVSEDQPYKCPKCGQQSVYNWRLCSKCNMRFVPEPLPGAAGEPARPPAIPSCPKCGGARSGTFVEGYNETPPAGDLPLPELPK